MIEVRKNKRFFTSIITRNSIRYIKIAFSHFFDIFVIYSLCDVYIFKFFLRGMLKVWRKYGESMEKVWRRYGEGVKKRLLSSPEKKMQHWKCVWVLWGWLFSGYAYRHPSLGGFLQLLCLLKSGLRRVEDRLCFKKNVSVLNIFCIFAC